MWCVECLRKGIQTKANRWGGCESHSRRKCVQCGGPSVSGAEFCFVCKTADERARRDYIAENPTLMPYDTYRMDVQRQRREILAEGLHLWHEALECVGQGLARVLEAFHGTLPDARDARDDEHKKAA